MILNELKQYLSQHKRAALFDLSCHFGIEPEALRGMLAMLQRKGWVQQLPAGTPCGGACRKCDSDSVEIFEWVANTGNSSSAACFTVHDVQFDYDREV